MNREIQYISYLKELSKDLNRIIKKIERHVDLTDDDKRTLRITISAFLENEKKL